MRRTRHRGRRNTAIELLPDEMCWSKWSWTSSNPSSASAARILSEDGFEVFPYTTEDLVAAEKLVLAGCQVLMPWGAPIGSGLGLTNPQGLKRMRGHFPDITLVVDAGIGLPSHAAAAMEMGYDAVLLTIRMTRDWQVGTQFPTGSLYDRGGFLGIDGPFRFDRRGIAQRALEVRRVQGGKVLTADPAPASFGQ